MIRIIVIWFSYACAHLGFLEGRGLNFEMGANV